MRQFRKKPVVVEAMRLVSPNWELIRLWCGGVIAVSGKRYVGITINTLEGNMFANVGDWIIKGVNGEFYPCKPDIFEKTYEEVKE